jgi:methionine synthase I (cobalamin-dependent)
MRDPDPLTTVVLDGGWAASLDKADPHCNDVQAEWIRTRPDDVRTTHARFVAAGARIVLTDTLRTSPYRTDDWAEMVDRAVRLARDVAGSAQVWATIGPISVPGGAWAQADKDERTRMTEAWTALARRYLEAGVDGFALQTFTDPVECAAAVEALRTVATQQPIAACLCPDDDGRLYDGSDPSQALVALRRTGATWVGFDCGTGPRSIEAAVALAPDADWAMPARGCTSQEDLVASLIRLSETCRFVGGCCGVGPDAIEELNRVSNLPFRARGDAAPVAEGIQPRPGNEPQAREERLGDEALAGHRRARR